MLISVQVKLFMHVTISIEKCTPTPSCLFSVMELFWQFWYFSFDNRRLHVYCSISNQNQLSESDRWCCNWLIFPSFITDNCQIARKVRTTNLYQISIHAKLLFRSDWVKNNQTKNNNSFKSYRKIVETNANSIPLTHIYMTTHFPEWYSPLQLKVDG